MVDNGSKSRRLDVAGLSRDQKRQMVMYSKMNMTDSTKDGHE